MNSTRDNLSTPSRNHSLEHYPAALAVTALTRLVLEKSVMRCWCARRRWRRRRRRRPAAPPPPPPAPRRPSRRWAAWTQRWTRRRARRASPRPTPGSSRRFSSRAIPSNFRGNCSPPPYRIRYDISFISKITYSYCG